MGWDAPRPLWYPRGERKPELGIRTNQNIAALTAVRGFQKTQKALQRNLERLSTANRINSAADDPAGLVVSENLRAQTEGLSRTILNTQTSLNRFRTAEGRFDEVQNQLQSIRTEALSALNTGASDAVARGAGQTTIQSSIESITRQLAQIDGNELGVDTATLDAVSKSLEGIDVTTEAGANQALQIIDTAISDVSTFRGELGAIQENRLEANIRSLSVERKNLLASESAIRDTDFAEEVVSFTRNQILTQANVAVLTQANASRQSALRLLGPGGSADGGGGRLLAIT